LEKYKDLNLVVDEVVEYLSTFRIYLIVSEQFQITNEMRWVALTFLGLESRLNSFILVSSIANRPPNEEKTSALFHEIVDVINRENELMLEIHGRRSLPLR
jgi:hypothetical protein